MRRTKGSEKTRNDKANCGKGSAPNEQNKNAVKVKRPIKANSAGQKIIANDLSPEGFSDEKTKLGRK